MTKEIQAEKRTAFGSRAARRLRSDGKMPAVLYGGDGDTESLSLPADEITRAIMSGEQSFDLRGALDQKTLLLECQWDSLGSEILHVDLQRIRAGEKIQIEVSVEPRGMAPGTGEGGIVNQHVHSVEISTIPSVIPDVLHVNINELQLGETMTANQIEDLPAEAELLTDPETIIVACVKPLAPTEEEEEAAAAGGPEPEVIGRPEQEEGEES